MSLLPFVDQLGSLVQNRKFRIILASQSPRRQQLLRENVLNGKVEFIIRASGFKEDHEKKLYEGRPRDYVSTYAVEKAFDICKTLSSEDLQYPDLLVIGCDTVVVHQDNILEKPENDEIAFRNLMSYSGKTQVVISGVCLRQLHVTDGEVVTVKEDIFSVETLVRFDEIENKVGLAYVATGEPRDKAGGYGIQGLGSGLISGIDGCFFNVMGFPVHAVSKAISKLPFVENLNQL